MPFMGYSQQLYIESGTTTASFENFVNDLGENTLNNQYAKPVRMHLGTGILIDVFGEKDRFRNRREWNFDTNVKWGVGLDYNKYKINTGFIYGVTTVPLVYDLDFVALKTGLNISFLNVSRIIFQAHANISYDWLIDGTRLYENKSTNLKKSDEFYKTLLNYHFGGDVEYAITDKTSFYVSYDLKRSFKKRNPENSGEESYQIYANSISVGLRLNLGKDCSCYREY
jgi:hypothetical protein